MKNLPVTVCPLCEVECHGEGFFATTLKHSLVLVAVKQCPECMKLVSMADVRYLDATQRAFLAKINGESCEGGLGGK